MPWSKLWLTAIAAATLKHVDQVDELKVNPRRDRAVRRAGGAHIEPGQIWVTEQYRDQLMRQPSLWRTSPVTLPSDEDRFNARKGDEPDLWIRLYRLEF